VTAAPRHSQGSDGNSVAVLAFVNMSADSEQEYFGDGIADEILNALAQIRGLHVAARTSSFYFKGKNADVKTIGEKLGVNHVLEGSVRKAGNRLRITAQLIEIHDGYHLWSESYDREITDIFSIQEEIARSVVGKLRVELGLPHDEVIVQQGTTNATAHSCYLRGRYYFYDRMNLPRLEQAIEAFKEAVAIDPAFAAGYGGLARACVQLTRLRPAKQIGTVLRAAYGKALELDPTQVDALSAKGLDLVHCFDFKGAAEVFETAVAHGLEQDVLVDFGLHLLVAQQREEELLKIGSEAERRDPLSATKKQLVGIALTWLRRSEEAIAKLKEGLALEPQLYFALLETARNSIRLGAFADAREAIKRARQIMGPDDAFALYMQGFWHVSQGQQAAAKAVLERMKTLHEADTSPSDYTYHIGTLSLDLREIDDGMAWLERACEENHWFMPIAHVQFASDEEVIGQPRFQALLKRMHLDADSLRLARSVTRPG
jgi:adenylate cyclase